MKAYLQTSESGWEEELRVQIPDPDDDTVVIPVTPESVSEAQDWLLHQLDIGDRGQIWVRVVAEPSDLATRDFTRRAKKLLDQRGRGLITDQDVVGELLVQLDALNLVTLDAYSNRR